MTKPYVILGASGKTGEALAEKLSSEGHDLFLTARDPDDISDLMNKTNAGSAAVDVFDPDSIQDAINIADKGEGLSGLAYCVGSIDLKPFKAAKDDDFLKCYELNVLGAIRALRAAEAGLKKAKGSVVLFSTVAVQTGFANHSVISSAKGAIEGIGRALAAEWANNIRVNVIAPSLSNTNMAQSLLSSEQMKKGIASAHPIQRLGEAADLASMAAFLLTDQSSWITGQIFGVDGGRSAIAGK